MPKFFKKNKFTIDIMSYNTYHGTKRTQKKNIVKFEYEYNVNFKNIHQSFSKSITIDTYKCPTVSDLKPLIATDLHIKPSQLTIEKIKSDQKLYLLTGNYRFQIFGTVI